MSNVTTKLFISNPTYAMYPVTSRTMLRIGKATVFAAVHTAYALAIVGTFILFCLGLALAFGYGLVMGINRTLDCIAVYAAADEPTPAPEPQPAQPLPLPTSAPVVYSPKELRSPWKRTVPLPQLVHDRPMQRKRSCKRVYGGEWTLQPKQ